MGEAKNKRDRLTPVQRMAQDLTHKLADEGLLIKAGFVSFMTACFPNEQPPEHQKIEMEQSFMAGALHLWMSVMVSLDEGEEITDKDMRRMQLIQNELDAYQKVLEARAAIAAKTKGNA